MLWTDRTYAILVHPQTYSSPIRLLAKVDPPNDLDIAGLHLEAWHMICPDAPSSCVRHVDPADIVDAD